MKREAIVDIFFPDEKKRTDKRTKRNHAHMIKWEREREKKGTTIKTTTHQINPNRKKAHGC